MAKAAAIAIAAKRESIGSSIGAADHSGPASRWMEVSQKGSRRASRRDALHWAPGGRLRLSGCRRSLRPPPRPAGIGLLPIEAPRFVRELGRVKRVGFRGEPVPAPVELHQAERVG